MNQEYLCQVCGAKCDDPCFPCRCAAIYFCSEAHRHRSASASFSSSSQHTDLDCVRFAEQLSRGGAELDSLLESVLGKSFSSLTPPRDACSLLEAAGVHGKGLFASCCPCGRKEKGVNGGSRCWPALPPATAAALPSLASLLLPLFLPGEEERTRHLASSAPPKGWREYLVARGLLPSLLSVASSETAAGSSSSAVAVAASPSSSPSPPSPSPAQFKEAAAAMTLLHRPLTASLTLAAAGWWSGEGGARIRGAGGEKRAERGGRSGAGRDDEDEDENDDDENGDNENDDASGGDETETPPRPFVLHVVGASVDTEVAQWPVWLELAALGGGGGGKGRRRKRNPHESLVVALVGPTVPVSLDRAAATFPLENSSSSSSKTITIRFARGRYHDVSGSLGEEADAVFAPDAGIAADFDGWRETILSWIKIRSNSNRFIPPPVLVTDLTEEAALLSAAAARKVVADAAAEEQEGQERRREEGVGSRIRRRKFRVSEPKLNPFRSPARLQAPGRTALPAAEGGWAFWIVLEEEEEEEETEQK